MMHPLEQAMKARDFGWVMTPTITHEDFKTMVRQIFDCSDFNHNGVLSLDEFKQFSLFILEAVQGLNLAQSDDSIEQMFLDFDKNHDG